MLVAQHTVYFPDAFLTQMREAMPSTLSFDDFLAACQRPLRRSIRVNTLKISVADFLQLTASYGWTLTPIPWCEEGFWIERDDEDALPLGSTAEHLVACFIFRKPVQCCPSPPWFADGNAPQRVMDVAAAPGSKTTQIAARMNNKGAILANEFSASRVKVLHAISAAVASVMLRSRILMAVYLVRQCQKCSMPFCWTLPAPAKAWCVKIPMR
ncbi:ribosomal RNA small subunit methyltransferase F [Escherichia coli]|uniref:Ribosomal RNA small subunit methyltransferase F n=1 Tax=Escherichia coli TaxID=562 RepID=A0A485JDH3_ECOLX|nr:ribosomal RNA small subunit methyltransferase F [Escherichia coli]